MKTFLGTIFAAALIFGSTTSSRAQDYNSAIGINIGAIMGANYKQFVSDRGALEFNLGYQIPGRGVMLVATYQHHIPLADNLKLYVGGGLNIGVTNLYGGSNGRFALGIDPTVGFEYKFDRAPVVLAVDYQPQINIISHMEWGIAALKIRFVL